MKCLSKKITTLLAVLFFTALLPVGIVKAGSSSSLDIVQTAQSAGQFNTLVKAIEAAGLKSTLQGEGPFTVFAPTDAAFAKLPPGTLDSLLKDPEKLKSILTYHVVPNKVKAKKVMKLDGSGTVNGKLIKITHGPGGVMVNNARVVQTDIKARNGIIHAIDTVLIP